MSEATVVTAMTEHELTMNVVAFGQEGFRIVSVMQNDNGYYVIVAQKDAAIEVTSTLHHESLRDLATLISNAVYDGMKGAT